MYFYIKNAQRPFLNARGLFFIKTYVHVIVFAPDLRKVSFHSRSGPFSTAAPTSCFFHGRNLWMKEMFCERNPTPHVLKAVSYRWLFIQYQKMIMLQIWPISARFKATSGRLLWPCLTINRGICQVECYIFLAQIESSAWSGLAVHPEYLYHAKYTSIIIAP